MCHMRRHGSHLSPHKESTQDVPGLVGHGSGQGDVVPVAVDADDPASTCLLADGEQAVELCIIWHLWGTSRRQQGAL